MKRLRLAIALHRSLPPEILTEIFLHYAAEILQCFINRPPWYTGCDCLWPFPWVLSRICSRWRRIALAEPRIWCTVGFGTVEQCDVPILNEAFRRGGKSPLWLSAGEWHGDVYDSFLRDVVCSQSKRIMELTLTIYWETFEDFLALPKDPFPVLESVQLSAIQGLGLQPNLRIPDSDLGVFRGAARLRRICIIQAPLLDVASVCFPMNLGLSWSQLTHIDFGTISIQVSIALGLMERCNALHECFLLMTDVHLQVAFPATSIRLPHLRKLAVQEAGPNRSLLAKFVRPLVLPSLEDFDFWLWKRFWLEDVASLADLAPIIEG